MYVKRLVFVYVCEGFSYLCAFVKIDCVFVFGLMYSCMLNAFRPTASGSKLLGQIFGYFFVLGYVFRTGVCAYVC